MEARLTISLKDDYKDLASLKNAMKTLFIVARVDLSSSHDDSYEEGTTAFVKAEKFGGVQCPRCRNYFNEDELVDGLCPRCHDVVSE